MVGLPKSISEAKIGDLERPSYLVSLNPFDKVVDAVQTLIFAGVSSAPVRSADFARNTPGGETHGSYYCGIVQLMDVVACFVKIYNSFDDQDDKNQHGLKINQSKWEKSPENLEKIQKCIQKFNQCTISELLTDPSFALRYSQVDINTTLQECALKLGPGKDQRLLVVDEDFNIVNIVTQTSILQYVTYKLSSSPELFNQAKDFLEMQLSDLLVERTNPSQPHSTMKVPFVDLQPNTLFKVKHSDLAIQAFNLMYTHNVSGVAVVDGRNGSLLGNLSQRDLRSLVAIHKQFEHLSLTAFEYLELVKKERIENSTKMYIKKQHYVQLHKDAYDVDEYVINDGDITAQKKNLPSLPANTILDNLSTTLTAHANIPSTLTISSQDSVGYLLFTLLHHRVKRVYLTNGILLPSCQLCHIPSAIITLSDVMLMFAGKTSSLSF